MRGSWTPLSCVHTFDAWTLFKVLWKKKIQAPGPYTLGFSRLDDIFFKQGKKPLSVLKNKKYVGSCFSLPETCPFLLAWRLRREKGENRQAGLNARGRPTLPATRKPGGPLDNLMGPKALTEAFRSSTGTKREKKDHWEASGRHHPSPSATFCVVPGAPSS